jgi:ATP-binding cassette subfamily A (ABC1) protein 3
MIGASKIVLLDEPSSGMDATARRILWDMLKKNKNGKIIILTTHYMEEADILGDRIGIMAEGDV